MQDDLTTLIALSHCALLHYYIFKGQITLDCGSGNMPVLVSTGDIK